MYKREYVLRKSHMFKLIRSLANLSKSISNVNFKFISCQDIYAYYVVMNNCNLHMCRFKFLGVSKCDRNREIKNLIETDINSVFL